MHDYIAAAVVAALLSGAQATGAPAATARPELPPCDGHFATLRLSAVKPGKMAVFEEAVRDQNAWYRAKKVTPYTRILRIMGRAPAGPSGYLEDEVATITVHLNPGGLIGIPHDAAYDAFVAKFQDSSTIKEERNVCLPDLTPP